MCENRNFIFTFFPTQSNDCVQNRTVYTGMTDKAFESLDERFDKLSFIDYFIFMAHALKYY